MLIHIHALTHTYTHTYTHAHTYIYTHAHISHTCVHTRSHTHMHVHTRKYTHVHTQTHTYTYTHKHTHTSNTRTHTTQTHYSSTPSHTTAQTQACTCLAQDNFLDNYLVQLQSENVQNARSSGTPSREVLNPSLPPDLSNFLPPQLPEGLNGANPSAGYPFHGLPQQQQQPNASAGMAGMPGFGMGGFGVPPLGGPEGFNMAGMAGLQVNELPLF